MQLSSWATSVWSVRTSPYEKEMDQLFDDFNFIEAYSLSQYRLRRIEDELACAEKKENLLEGQLEAKREREKEAP